MSYIWYTSRMRFGVFQQYLFIILLLSVSFVFLWLILPFLQPIFWAIVLATLFYPLQKFWERATHGLVSVSALLTIVSISLLVFVPIYFLGSAMLQETINVYYKVSDSGVDVSQLEDGQMLKPVLQYVDRIGLSEERVMERISDGMRNASGYIASRALSIGQNALRFALQTFVMLYILFYLLRKGPDILHKILHIIPLGARKEKRLIKKFIRTSRATIKGTLIIGIIQGILGGILFWAVGIGGALLWGSVMAVLSIIPAVGAGLIWGPAGILLIVSGQVTEGVIVLFAGTLIIGMVDNVLRPPLVGKDTQMPDVLVLLSTLGGLALFGVSGFIIGPIITSLFIAMWEMFEEEHRDELVKMG